MAAILDEWKARLGELARGERAELALFLLTSLEPEDEGAEAA